MALIVSGIEQVDHTMSGRTPTLASESSMVHTVGIAPFLAKRALASSRSAHDFALSDILAGLTNFTKI